MRPVMPRSPHRRTRSVLLLAAAVSLAVLAVKLTTRSGADLPDAAPLGSARVAAPGGPVGQVASSVHVAGEPSAAIRTTLERVVEGRFGPAVPTRGRTSSVRGTITREGRPDPTARINITAGANRGIELRCDAEGRFASGDLYPGIGSIVIRSGGDRVVRELDLAQSEQGVFDLEFVTRPRVTGRIVAADGAPIPGARVSVDGQDTLTDSAGWFGADCVASGDPLLLVEATGFVPYRESLRGERRTAPLELELEHGCRLTVSLAPLPGGDGGNDAEVYLIPMVRPFSARAGQPSFPGQVLCPLRIPAGGSRVVEGLPATRFEVFAFHQGAKGKPATVWVQTDRPGDVKLEWEPMPRLSCTVTRAGAPVAGVSVSILTADPYRATMRHLGSARQSWRSQPMQILPGIDANTETTGSDGSCALPRWGDRLDPGFLVIATERLTITRQLTADDAELAIELADPIAASTTSVDRVAVLRTGR